MELSGEEPPSSGLAGFRFSHAKFPFLKCAAKFVTFSSVSVGASSLQQTSKILYDGRYPNFFVIARFFLKEHQFFIIIRSCCKLGSRIKCRLKSVEIDWRFGVREKRKYLGYEYSSQFSDVIYKYGRKRKKRQRFNERRRLRRQNGRFVKSERERR